MVDIHTDTNQAVRIDLTLLGDRSTTVTPEPSSEKHESLVARWLQDPTEAVLLFDRRGHLLETNHQVIRFFLFDREEIRSYAIADLFEGLDSNLLGWITDLANQRRQVVLHLACRRKDKTVLPVDAEIHAVRWGTPPTDCFCFRLRLRAVQTPAGEIAKRHASEPSRTERLTIAGSVAGQIAHDFNNLLTPLVAYPQMIRKDLPPDSASVEFLDMMEKTALDMSQLTQQLLSLSRRRQSSRELFNLLEVIDQAADQLRPALPASVQLVVEKPDLPLKISGNKSQMLRAIQYLCQNALEAMEEKGTLRLQVENIYLDTPVGQHDAVNIGEYAKISVADTGTGIPLEIREKIFDPFFTTKKATKKRGSGLSLSIVHSIVMDLHGYIDVESEVGQGSTFHLFIPTFREQGAPATTPPSAPASTVHKESVLVVDDDQLQVSVLSGFLYSLGYATVGVQSGEEALTLIRDRKHRFDLVILDMFMAKMDGLGTFMAIRKICPTQKTILMSGVDRAAKRVALAQRLGAGRYLQKPITLDALKAALHAEMRPGAVAAAAAPPIRILITDDDRLIRKLFLMIISSEFPQAVIDQASDGDEAVRMFQASPYELLIMDLQMPNKGGLEAFREIAQICRDQNREEPPVIFCTGFAPPTALDEIIGDGTKHSLLRKPVRVEDLTRVVRDSL